MEGTIEYKNELGQPQMIQVRNGVMNLNNLHLNAIPFEIIKHFDHITVLKCSYNKLSEIPETVVNSLPQLSELDVSYNKLTKLPENIGNWKKLRKLIAAHNLIEELPMGFSKLNALEYFDIKMNPFYEALQLYMDRNTDTSEQMAAHISVYIMKELHQAFVSRTKRNSKTYIRLGCLMDKEKNNKLIRLKSLNPVFAKLESEILAGEMEILSLTLTKNRGNRTHGHGIFFKELQLHINHIKFTGMKVISVVGLCLIIFGIGFGLLKLFGCDP